MGNALPKTCGKKWYQHWYVWVLGLIGLTVLMRLTVLAPREIDIVIGHDTTRITGPLKADGTVDYVAYLNEKCSQGVTRDNNAAVLLIQAFGPDEFFPGVSRDIVSKALGIEELPAGGEYFTPLENHSLAACKNESVAAEEQLYKASGMPWSAGDYPVLEAWLKSNGPQLDLMVSASKRSRFYLPILNTDGEPTVVGALGCPYLRRLSEACSCLAARAMLKYGEGQTTGAWEDALALYRLGRLIGKAPGFFACSLGQTYANVASHCAQVIAVRDRPSADEARRRLVEFESLGPLPSPAETADVWERMALLDGVMGMKQEHGVDWNYVLREVNACYDLQVAAIRTPKYADAIRALRALDDKIRRSSDDVKSASARRKMRLFKLIGLLAREPRSEIVAKGLLVLYYLSYEPLLNNYYSVAIHLELSKIALALAAFKADHGAYPAKLSELKGEGDKGYLKSIPPDVFDPAGGPPVYRRTADGYVLYSLGSNMKDDGGEESDSYDDGDIVVRAGSE